MKIYYCVKNLWYRTVYDQGYDNTYFKVEAIKDLQEDLIYFNTNHSDEDLSDHADIFIENNQFIHASSAKGKIVISGPSEEYYNKCFF